MDDEEDHDFLVLFLLELLVARILSLSVLRHF
jgi:hypothetical protein